MELDAKQIEKERYANIDLLKTIAIIMVIILHVGLLKTDFIQDTSISKIIQYALRIICEGVPIFIFVNGFLILNKKEFDLKKHIYKTIRIFTLLITWSIILTICSKLILKEKIIIKDIILNVFNTDINNKYTGILWFLQSLITLYIFYPILKTLHDKNKKMYNYLFIIVLISTVGMNLLNLISQVENAIFSTNNIKILYNYINKFQILNNSNFLVFFMLGGYVYELKEKFNERKIRIKWVLYGIIAWIVAMLFAYFMSKTKKVLYANNFGYSTINMLIFLVAWFAITYNYTNKNKFYNKIIKKIGENSLGIYFLHILVIKVLNLLIVENALIYRLTKVICTLFVSLLITVILKRIPIIKNIVRI